MKLQFLSVAQTPLAAEDPSLLENVRAAVLARVECIEVFDPAEADAIVLNEAPSFKEWRYIRKLGGDPIVGRFPHKTYTLNTDDAGTGLLRGLYTSLETDRFDARLHRAVPFATFANERVLERRNEPTEPKKFLAGWRGNPVSNQVRKELLRRLAGNPRILVEATESWFNHPSAEKDRYVDLLLSSKFSLCPAGWASVSFRIYESMALGIAPVILANEFVPPRGPDWPSFSITLKESQVVELETILARKEDDYREMGARARMEWERFFSPEKVYGYYADALLELAGGSAGASKNAEWRRWNSFKMYWTNYWTLPQRLENRLKKLRG